jgi:hypothetical protein
VQAALWIDAHAHQPIDLSRSTSMLRRGKAGGASLR